MDTIRIKVSDLLPHLKENRILHIEEYEAAMKAYRIAMVAELHRLLGLAESSKDVEHHIKLERPVTYLDSYDEIISMLMWTTEASVELDHQEFKQYVQDEWSWRNSFANTLSNYGSAGVGGTKKQWGK